MKNIRYIVLAFLFFSSSAMISQDKKIKRADKEFEDFSYVEARKGYLKVAEEGFLSEELLMRLGDSYYFTADYTNAAKWYGELYNFKQPLASEYLYRYAQSLKSDGQYSSSDKIMEQFNKASGGDARAELFVNERNYLEEIEAQSGRFELQPFAYNSELSDFAPAYYGGTLVFASNGLGSKKGGGKIHSWNDQPFLDIYTVPFDSSSDEVVKGFDSKVNTKYHESTAVFTKDGKTMYFTRNNCTKNKYKQDSDGTNKLKMYKGTLTEDRKWEVVELPFNSDEYSVAHPALSTDEKTLYFASDMPGGKGMSDLYKVAIQGDGFGTPVSLGDNINTEFRETFPFVSAENKLYFASDGHPGLGGLDVFVTELNESGNAKDIFNVGRPVNSPKDDFTFIVNDTSGIGYFASNRDGGKGDDDIYSFRKVEDLITNIKDVQPDCSQTVSGVIIDKNTKAPIANAKVALMNLANQVVAQQIAGADGSFSFPVECSESYCVRGAKAAYGFDETCFKTTAQSGFTTKETLELEAESTVAIGQDLTVVLDLLPIYFDLDKDFIRADAQIELGKVIQFMKLYPTVKVDVRSHTDSRARDAYNMDLSSRRNASTINYIVNKGGIDRSRLTGRGYGETQLTNHCSNNVKCDEGLHQLNRRSEFIVVSK